MKQIQISIISLCLSVSLLQAQQMTQLLPTYTDYSYWNPAAISPSGLFNGAINYFTDAQGSDVPSRFMNASIHYPIKFQKIAFGAQLSRNNFSGLKQSKLGFGAKYNLNFNELSSLSLGIGAGLYITGIDNDNFIASDPGDQLLQTNGNNAFNYNISAGFIYRNTFISGFASTQEYRKLLVAFSTQQILSGEEQILDNGYAINRKQHFFTLISYKHPLISGVGTTFKYSNSYALDYKMNHSLVANFDFNQIFDLDIGYNSAGKIIMATGLAFSNIRVDDRLRMKLGWNYDTRSILKGNQIGFSFSLMYTYDYDFTFYEL